MTESGDKIATACNDGCLRWFDLPTGKNLGQLECFDTNCTSLIKHPTRDQFIVAGGATNQLKVFDRLEGGTEPSQLFIGHLERTVRDMAYHPNGSVFVAAGGPEVHGFKAEKKACLFDLPGHDGRSVCTEYSTHGRWT